MFNYGDQVVRKSHRDNVGSIGGPSRRLGGETWYPGRFPGGTEQVLADDLEAYAGEQDIRSLLRSGVFASEAALSRRLTHSKLSKPLRDAIYSLDSSRTEFHPHQYRPLLKFISSDRPRILIADEVGLGKTIEAGYILREQKARAEIDRILIVCPASLRHKWEMEMWRRFGEKFDVLDASRLRQYLAAGDGANAPRKRLHGIVSLQSLRAQSMLDLVEERPPDLDLLIVDEAHHCRNSETRQHRAVRALAFASEAVVVLTATPLHLRSDDLFNLLRLLLPEEFDRVDVFRERLAINQHIVHAETHLRRLDGQGPGLALASLRKLEHTPHARRFAENPLYVEAIESLARCVATDKRLVVELQDTLSRLNLLSHVMTRTKKREAYPNAAKREPVVHQVVMTPAERDVYARIYDFCATRYTMANGDLAAQFALITLQRQLASGIHAMLEHYGESIADAQTRQAFEDEVDESDDVLAFDDGRAPDSSAGGQGLVDDPAFVTMIRECADLVADHKDSRFDKLCEVLRQNRKVVVFATFRRSLRYLERRLTERGIGCVRVDGSVPMNPFDAENDERGKA